MKRNLLVAMSLVLALALVMPSAVLAAKPVPLSASGIITAIDEGLVAPAGNSGRFRIVERQIEGVILEGDITGAFVLSYQGNVNLATQAGNIHGTVTAGDYVFRMNGKVAPLQWLGVPFASPAQLSISGHCTLIDSAHGIADLNAIVTFVPTPDGHVAFVIPDLSSFSLTGQWQP